MNMSISVSKSGLERKIGKKTIMRDRIQDCLVFFGYFYKVFGVIASILIFLAICRNNTVIASLLISISAGVVVTLAWMWFVLSTVSYIALFTAGGVIWGICVSDYAICAISLGVGAVYYFAYKLFNK